MKIKSQLKVALNSKGKGAVKNVVRLLCLYLIHTVLFAGNGHTLKWGFVKYVEDIDAMSSFAWPEAIMHALMSSIDRSNGDATKVTGCTLALQVNHMETFNFI